MSEAFRAGARASARAWWQAFLPKTVVRIARRQIGAGTRIHYVALYADGGQQSLCGRQVDQARVAAKPVDCRVCRGAVGLPNR